jgi:hypothetical protein
MKQLALFALALALTVPAAAGAQTLAQNANTRQAILEVEYQLLQPGVSPDRVAALQARAAQLQAQANGSDFPTATIPQWGTCDADNSVIAYLQDQLATTNLDYQQTVIDQRALYDLRVNLKQRGC